MVRRVTSFRQEQRLTQTRTRVFGPRLRGLSAAYATNNDGFS